MTMKKISSGISFLTAGIAYLTLTVSAHAAAGSICPKGQFAPLCNLKLDQGNDLVGRIVTILLIVAIVLALIFLVIGGIRWITSGGDKGKLESARGTVTAAVVGLVVALSAFLILNIVTYFFLNGSISSFDIPTIVGP